MNKQVLKSKMDIRDVDVKADYAQMVTTWSKYGYTEVPVMATNAKGRVIGRSGMKIIRQKIGNDDPFCRCSMPENQPFVPHEEIDLIVNGLEKRMVDSFPEYKDFKIENILKKDAHKGNTQYWIVQTNTIAKIDKSFQNDDKVKFGFIVRNGYNTRVSLGIDLLSFRIICSNGAISRGHDFGSTSIRHVGKDPKRLVTLFHDGLLKAVQGWMDLENLYNKLAVTNLNQKMAEHIYKMTFTPDKYFPEYYDIQSEAEVKKGKPQVILTNEGKSVTLWENFNDMTYGLWRARDPHTEKNKKGDDVKMPGISFFTVAQKEMNLHRAMATIVNDQKAFA